MFGTKARLALKTTSVPLEVITEINTEERRSTTKVTDVSPQQVSDIKAEENTIDIDDDIHNGQWYIMVKI